MSEAAAPHSFSEAAAVLSGAAAHERPVRIVGGATKLGWGATAPPRALQLHTTNLSGIEVHADGATATINAGTPLVRAQTILGRSGLMLAIDPQLGLGRRPAATVGGVVATADCGPLSHRYGPVREQVIGIEAALADGTIVRSGPRFAGVPLARDTPGAEPPQDGYDLPKLLTGSFGTLGLILAIDFRVRPLPGETATAMGATNDPARLRAVVGVLAQHHPELEAFDVAWHAGPGGLLAQVGGDGPGTRAAAVAETMRAGGMEATAVRTDDSGLWARQRAGQRSAAHAVVRIQAQPAELDSVLDASDQAQGTLVGRAALGVAYVTVDVNRIAALRAALPSDTFAVVLDLPAAARGAIDVWGVPEGAEIDLMRSLKRRFDPSRICNPGIFVGSI